MIDNRRPNFPTLCDKWTTDSIIWVRLSQTKHGYIKMYKKETKGFIQQNLSKTERPLLKFVIDDWPLDIESSGRPTKISGQTISYAHPSEIPDYL